MSTVTITSQKTITVEIGSAIIRSRVVAGRIGSTTRKTERELPTGIMPQPRGSTGELHQTLSGRARRFADALNRAGRTLAGAVLTNSGDGMRASAAAEHSAAWTVVAARRETSAAAEVPVVKACPAAEDSAVVAEAAVVDSAVVAVAAVVAAAAVEGGSHVKI
jgi:hypothetical protein